MLSDKLAYSEFFHSLEVRAKRNLKNFAYNILLNEKNQK